MDTLFDEFYISLCTLADITLRKWRLAALMGQLMARANSWHEQYNTARFIWLVLHIPPDKLEEYAYRLQHEEMHRAP